MKRWIIAAMALGVSTAGAQSKVPTCDPKSALLNSPTVFGIGRATIVKACPAFELGGANWLKANLDSALKLNGVQALGLMLHGNINFFLPPKDTAVTPPPVIVPIPVPVDSTPKPPVDSTPKSSSSWTKLGAAGQLYSFQGLHVARWTLGDSAKALYVTAYGQLACGLSGFNGKQPSGGSGLGYCEIGPTIYDTLRVPVAMGPLTAATIVVPRGSPGSAKQDVSSGGGNGVHTDGTGSFRTTCNLTKFAFIDPIVFPGDTVKSHLHMFFGNTAINASTDSASIASQGNSTCRGGILNRTAYWTPAMIDASGNAVMPNDAVFYYKTGYNMPPANTQPLPVGLRMIAGDKNATGVQQVPGPLLVTDWTCLVHGGSGPTIPHCAEGDTLRLAVYFPSCWDGKNLDSPDHKAHMAYPNFAKGQCPSTHPVQVPQISEHFDWPVSKGMDPSSWHLSSDMDLSKPGLSAHADWLMGWDPATMNALVVNCLQKALDCGVGGIGGNRSLY